MFLYTKLPLKRVEGPEDVPVEKHWAILIFRTESIHVPGDERSRQCPGHGYPAHTRTSKTYEYWAAMDQETLKQALLELEEENSKSYKTVPPYVVVQVQKCSVAKRVEVEIGA